MKVVHVRLIFKKTDHYFGSISAIYDYLSEDDIGMTKNLFFILFLLICLLRIRL